MMYEFAVTCLILFILLGVIGVGAAFTYPRKGVESPADKVKQKIFQRGLLTILICSAALSLLLADKLSPQGALAASAVLLFILEYGVTRTAKYG